MTDLVSQAGNDNLHPIAEQALKALRKGETEPYCMLEEDLQGIQDALDRLSGSLELVRAVAALIDFTYLMEQQGALELCGQLFSIILGTTDALEGLTGAAADVLESVRAAEKRWKSATGVEGASSTTLSGLAAPSSAASGRKQAGPGPGEIPEPDVEELEDL